MISTGISCHINATRRPIAGRLRLTQTLQYVPFSYADEANALVRAGMSESFANLYVERRARFNEELIKPSNGRTPENTTPTGFEDFAVELAQAHKAM